MFTDFSELNNSDEVEARQAILAEDNARTELLEMAEFLESQDVENDFDELLEMVEMTAEQNPLSETAVDLKEQMAEALKEVA